MKKAITILLMMLISFFPTISVFFAVKSAENLEKSETLENTEARIIHDLQQLGRASDESNYLIREHSRISQILISDKKELLMSYDDPELHKYLENQSNNVINEAGFPCEFEYLFFDDQGKFKRSLHFGNDLGLQTISFCLKELSEPKLPLEPWQGFYRNTLNDLMHNNITKIAIRQPGKYMSLSGQRITKNLFLFALADLSDFTTEQSNKGKLTRFPGRDYGLGVFFPDTGSIFFSEYFVSKPELKTAIKKLAGKIGPRAMQTATAGYQTRFFNFDPLKRCRFFAVIAPQIKKSGKTSSSKLLLAMLAIASCVLFKVLAEKLLMGRGPDVSFKIMVPAIFAFLVIQPIFASAYLAGEIFRVSYANETRTVTDKLEKDLANIDLAAADGTAEILNTARGFNSIERIASFAEMPFYDNETSLALRFLNQLRETHGGNMFSSFWLCIDENRFSGIRWEATNRYSPDDVNNMVAELFKSRFLEIISLHNGKAEKPAGTNRQNLGRDLKGEYSKDFFLKIFGSDAFFRFRQNSDIRIDFSANYRTEQMLATPVFYQNRLYAYAAWYIERTNANLMFPFNRLRLRGQSPRVAFHGDEHSTSTLNFSMKEITDRHPELVRIGESAQGTKTRTSSIIETAETTQINVAIPGIYSNFTIAGSELMRSFAVFRHHMGRRLSLLVAAILICGGVLAFAGAIYFIWPLQELTAATTEIFMGNFKIRIHEDHPDEFAALGKSFNNMAESLEEGMLLKSFVTDSVRREVAGAENSALAEKTETKIATIIFAALCDFASYQKSHAAQEVFNRLQHLLQAADGATRQFGGEIDKMIEDKVMIVFEHPQNESDDIPQRAIKAATFICRQIMAETGMIVAAGINTGVTVAGIMGAEQARLSRTVVGDPVNLAARLAYEAVKTGGGIVISGQIVDAVPEGCIVEKLPINRVKGKTQSIEAFKVLQQEKTNG